MITVVNRSNLVSATDVKAMVSAVAYQVRHHAAPTWGKLPIPVVFATTEADAQPGSWVLVVLDDPDQANALGYHNEAAGALVYGRVFARPVLDNGGDALGKPLSVASVLSHEVLEVLVDPSVNLWAVAGDGTAVALEVCDPVESSSYKIGQVTVSDFVTPAWFDPQATPGEPLDYLGQCTAPLRIAKGGYAITITQGHVSHVFGEDYPDWRRATKQTPLARTARRAPGLTRIPDVPTHPPAPTPAGSSTGNQAHTGFWRRVIGRG